MLQTYLFGVLFGVLLSRAAATSHQAITGMFLFEDPRLPIVMAVGIGVAAIGIRVARALEWTAPGGEPLPFSSGPPRAHWLAGSLLFGTGWALTGSCPGTALAQVGEGQLMGLFTVLGLVLGTVAYRRWFEAPAG